MNERKFVVAEYLKSLKLSPYMILLNDKEGNTDFMVEKPC